MQLVPEELLTRTSKVLFIIPQALGDFTYLQTCFLAFAKKYPHIRIDIWLEDEKRTYCFWEWKNLSDFALSDWARHSYAKVYSNTYSWGRVKKLVKEARAEKYELIVTLGAHKSPTYVRLAKRIGPRAFIAAVVGKRYMRVWLIKKLPVSLDASLGLADCHFAYLCQHWFERLFACPFTAEPPQIIIPKEWLSYGKLCFIKWGISPQRFEKVIFLNVFARNAVRCWPLDRLVNLILTLRKDERFVGAYFIVNVEPALYEVVKAFFGNYCLPQVFLFTAHVNFFQLPAVISLCDLVVSVETSVIHIASALQVPVIALMRQKNPEWGPFYSKSLVIYAPMRKGWVEDISYQVVAEKVQEFVRSL